MSEFLWHDRVHNGMIVTRTARGPTRKDLPCSLFDAAGRRDGIPRKELAAIVRRLRNVNPFLRRYT